MVSPDTAGNGGVVHVAACAPYLKDYAQWLEQHVEAPIRVYVSKSFNDDDVLPLLPGARIVLTSYWNPRFARSATSLRFLQVPGAGWDKIDATSIPEGVLVANCYEHEAGIAEYVMMTCLALSRQLIQADRTIRMGVWRLFPAVGSHPFFEELGGKTMGIVGLGRIGRAVSGLAGAFGMRRIAVDADPDKVRSGQDLGLDAVRPAADLDWLLQQSDFVVLALPLSRETRGVFNRDLISRMRKSAFLVNPARAEICNEHDLYEALRTKAIAGAALDAWWNYPKNDEVVAPSLYPYQELDNVIMTPHASGSTSNMLARRMQVVAGNIDRFLRGDPVVNVVAELSRYASIQS